MAEPIWHRSLRQHFLDQRALAVLRGFESTDAWRNAVVSQRRKARRAIERATGGKLPWDDIDRVHLTVVMAG